MLKKGLYLSLLSAALMNYAWAQDIAVDDFESYADTAAMQAQWVSSSGSTTSTFLFDANTSGQPYPTSGPGALDGQAALFDGTIGIGNNSVNRWATPFSASPSATQNVFLSVDLGYDAVLNNKKLTLGLRYTDGAVTQNIIELGFWNAFPFPPVLQFAHRAILMPGGNNWQPYGLDDSYNELTEMDHSGNPDVNGLGFHRFTATISQSSITFGLDLFADGINNVTGLPGLDAEDVVAASVTANGFNSLRFGIPSGDGGGGSSANPLLAVDNVVLRYVDVMAPGGNADFNGDGRVDGRDFLIWQRGFGTPDALLVDGDADGDNDVDSEDLLIWQDQYVNGPLAAFGVVPEPTSAVLLLLAATSVCGLRRR